MEWNRKEIGGLLMVGASIIAAFETAIFDKWVDAQIANNENLSSLIAWVGFLSTIVFAIVWVIARVEMVKPLPKNEKLSWKISSFFIVTFFILAFGWMVAI